MAVWERWSRLVDVLVRSFGRLFHAKFSVLAAEHDDRETTLGWVFLVRRGEVKKLRSSVF